MQLSRLIAPLALVVALGSPAAAQEAAPSHRAAVRRLMEVTRVRESLEQGAESMLRAQMQQAPQLARYETVLRDFYREEMSWAVLEPEFTRLYLEVFTEAELRELIAFYESALGQRLIAKMPLVMAKSNQLTSARLQGAMPRLMARLQAAAQAQGTIRRDSARRDSARTPNR